MKVWGSMRSLKRLAMVVGILVAVVLIANGFMAWRTDQQLKDRIAKIRAAGDPASISDLAPAPIPADENAAAMLDKIAPRLDEFSKENAVWGDTPLGKEYDQRTDRGEPATKEQIAAIRAIIEKYSDITAALAAAAACTKYASTADYTADYQKFLDAGLQNQVRRIRTAARFLAWSAEVSLAAGRHEQAIEQGLEIMRLARLYDSEPLLVNYLVSLAVRGYATPVLYDGLAAGPVSPALHAAVERELALHDTPERLIHALKTDRAYSSSVASQAVLGPELKDMNVPFGGLVFWPMKRQFIGAMDFIDVQTALVGKSWPKVDPQLGTTGAPNGTMAVLLIPALQASYDAESRVVGVMRSLRIFNALREFAEKNGREAKDLAELNLPPAMTIDPYSGQPLRLKHTDDGWMVYSVMQNGVDDDGDFIDRKDFGVGPPKYRIDTKPQNPTSEDSTEPPTASVPTPEWRVFSSIA